MHWNIPQDRLTYRFVKSEPEGKCLSKRQILSIVSSIYDPLGLLAPITVRAKIILRKLWAYPEKISWDEPVPCEIEREWSVLYEDLQMVDMVNISRSLTPNKCVGQPTLVIFSDGSPQAYGAVAYCRWQLQSGVYKSRIIAAKSRIAPLKVINIVRLELCGTVLSKRLREFICKEAEMKFERVIHLIDSEIVKAMINLKSYGFNTFAANRIGEIHQGSDSDEWFWISTELNISDLITRGCQLSQVLEDSEWVNGPEFLKLDFKDWPVKQQTNVIDIPELKKSSNLVGAVTVPVESLTDRIDLFRFSSWALFKGTTARILKLYQRFKKNRNDYESEILPKDLEEAEKLWIRNSQSKILGHISEKRYAKFNPCLNSDGIIEVGGRTERWLEATWNRQKFILLPANNKISDVMIRDNHKRTGYLGISATILMIRSK